jgi:hypothetical protein
MCNQESIPEELKFLHNTFKQNSYSGQALHHALNPPCREDIPREEFTSVAFLTLCGTYLHPHQLGANETLTSKL